MLKQFEFEEEMIVWLLISSYIGVSNMGSCFVYLLWFKVY